MTTSAYLDMGRTRLWTTLRHQRERKHTVWPWRLLLLVNTGLLLGLALALISIRNDNVAHSKVKTEIWEHGDIFHT